MADRTRRLRRYELWLARRGLAVVAGVDEAGRGPLAGPVVAAAVVLLPGLELPRLDDSKRLSPAVRAASAAALAAGGHPLGVGLARVAEVDALNIRQATFTAMRRAVAALPVRPDLVVVDGEPIPDLGLPQRAVVGGDGRVAAVAAASIVAKVVRDGIMDRWQELYPVYGFGRNRGYATPEHLAALARFGASPAHRRSFAPVQARFGAGGEV